MNYKKHWLFWSCHDRPVLLIDVAANDACSAFPPFLFFFFCPNCECGWHHTGLFVLLQIQFRAALVKALWKGRQTGKAYPAKWTGAGLRGFSDSNESTPSTTLRKLMLSKMWGYRGRYLGTWAPFTEDVWLLRFSAAFSPAYCLLVYLSYLSGPSKIEKITLEGSKETSSGLFLAAICWIINNIGYNLWSLQEEGTLFLLVS